MKFLIKASPNHSKNSRKLSKIKYVIIHYTGMQSMSESIERLTNKKQKVSSHYIISRSGKIVQLVKDEKIAWHAGKSKWKNLKNLNDVSLGIELQNKGHFLGYQKYPEKQIKSLFKLSTYLKKRFRILPENFLGHSDIAPLRKLDPGEKFPWDKLRNKGIGVKKSNLKNKNFKNKNFFEDKKKYREIFFKNIFKIGYRYFDKKINTKCEKKIISAFQCKFVQDRVSGKIDKKTLIISHFLANKN